MGKLGDQQAVPDLLLALEADDDDGLREAVAHALGELGAVAAIPNLCLRLASGPAGAEAPRINSPRLCEPCEAMLESLRDIGFGSGETIKVINPFTLQDHHVIRSDS